MNKINEKVGIGNQELGIGALEAVEPISNHWEVVRTDQKSIQNRWKPMRTVKNNEKPVEIKENHWRLRETSENILNLMLWGACECQKVIRREGELDPINENQWKTIGNQSKSLKMRGKGFPRRVTGHFTLGTSSRDEAMGGGRGRVSLLVKLNYSGSTRSEAKGLDGFIFQEG